MICPPCAAAADQERRYQALTGTPSGLRGTHRRCSGCPCQHRPITTQRLTAAQPTT